MDLTTTPHLYGSDQRMLTDVCAGIYHDHARSQELGKKINFNRFVCAKKINLSLNLVPQITAHLRAVEETTLQRLHSESGTPPFYDLIEVSGRLGKSAPRSQQ